ncbi:hypothetical protein ACP275_10G084400 [Erythranthe tilingii]
MGKKMKFPFLFKSTETPSAAAAAAWPWPACVNNPKTLSFRADGNNIFKTMNSAFLDDDAAAHDSCSTVPDYYFQDDTFSGGGAPAAEETAVVGGMRSDRLFFEPGETTSRSILQEEEAKPYEGFPYKESHVAIMAVDSVDPFLDFRVSMEEMVAAHGLKEWDCLQELLTCFLRVNGKSNHGYIVGAFVDLLLHLALSDSSSNNKKKKNNGASSSSSSISTSAIDEQCSSSSTTTQYSFTSPLSFSSSTYSSLSHCLSLMENDDGNEIVADKNG